MSLNVYKASAGSGKTYTLALKYIALALASNDCRNFTHILAVTFTNKATGEMKDRILQYLFAIANKEKRTEGDKDFLQQLLGEIKKSDKDISEAEIEKRAQKTLKAIMHDYDHFKVETIDSFFQSLLTSLAYEMKLTRGFKVDLNNDTLIAKAVNNMLLTLDQNPDKKLAQKIASFQDEYMEENAKWDISVGLKDFAKSFLFNDVIMSHVEDLEKFMSDPKAITLLSEKLRNQIRTIEEQIKQKINKDDEFETLFDDNYFISCNKTTIGTLRNYVKAISEGQMDTALSPTALKALEDPTTLLKKDYKDKPHDALFRAIKKIRQFRTESLPLYNTCLLTLNKLNSLSLLGAIEHELTKQSTENGTFLLSNTPQLFSQLVREDDSSFIFEKLGTTIHHIMIDEFQDTSRKQWENFKKLLFEMLSQGRECMVVGDVKQSIYRWRGGDWEILKDIEGEKDFIRRGIKVDTDPEKKIQADGTKKGNYNYRSLPNIVHFNNDFFKRIAEAEGQGSPIYDIYKDVEQEPKKKDGKGYIRIQLLPKVKGTTTAEMDKLVMDSLYEKIKDLKKDFNVPYHDMTILVRENKESKKIIDYFNSKKDEPEEKPVLTTEEAFMYASSDMVCAIIYALKYYAEGENDTVSKQALEETYQHLVEASEAQIDKNTIDSFIDSISNNDKTVCQWKDMPLPEVIEQIVERLHFNDMNDLGQSAYLYSFIDDVIQYVDNNTADLKTFLKYWDDKLCNNAISTDSEDAISIMTIHKAKGLEKHTVFIPFADFDIEKGKGEIVCDLKDDDKIKDNAQLNRLLGDLPVIPIELGKKMEASLYKPVYEEEHQQQKVDTINTLYVAFTRARANLFIWSKKGGNTVCKYVESYVGTLPADQYHLECNVPETDVYEYGELEPLKEKGEKAEDKDKKSAINPFSSDQKYADNTVGLCQSNLQHIGFVQSSDSKDYITALLADRAKQELVNKFADAKKGTLYHDLFSRLLTENDLPQALESMQKEGKIKANEVDAIRDLAQSAISQQAKEGHHWFDGTFEHVYNERDILYRKDDIVKTRRPDRFMVNDDKIVLIDYKFTEDERNNKKKYQRQVGSYMRDLEAIFHKPVEAYLWYISDNGESSIEDVSPTL